MEQAVLADNALTTVDAVRELLGIPAEDHTSDNLLIRLINAASAWAETVTGRRFGLARYVQRCYGTDSQRLVLKEYPILSVESVRDLDGSGEFPKDYDFGETGQTGVLYREAGWAAKGYPGGLAGDSRALKRYLEVAYTAGYVLPKDATEERPATLPADLEQVVWGIVEQEFLIRNNGSQGLASFTISDVSWTFDKQPRQSWTDVLARYERVG